MKSVYKAPKDKGIFERLDYILRTYLNVRHNKIATKSVTLNVCLSIFRTLVVKRSLFRVKVVLTLNTVQ